MCDFFNKIKYFVIFALISAAILIYYQFTKAQIVNIGGQVNEICGDNIIESGEQCDGSALGGKVCTYLGFDSGTLACSASCRFDTTNCITSATATATPMFSANTGGNYTLVNSNDSAQITLSKNFYTQDLQLYMFSYDNSVFALSKPPPSGKSFVGKTYKFIFADSNGGTVSALSQPATLVLAYADSDVSGIDQSTLAPYRIESGGLSWQLISGATVDAVNHKVTFSTANFSSFALFGSPLPPQQQQGGGGGFSFNFGPPAPSPEVKEKIIKLADFDGDGKIDIVDLSILLYYAGPGHYSSRYDLNSDGRIDINDISILLYYWTA